MKKFFIILFIVFLVCEKAFAFSHASFLSENLYPINDKNGGGYINKNGKIILEQKYNFAFRYIGDYAIVQGKNLKYGVIDKNGKTVIDFEYDNLDNLNENLVTYNENGKFGFIDIVKNQKSKAIYDNIKKFKGGLAPVCVNDKWGFINTKGEYVIPPKYYAVSNFSEGLAAVSSSEHKTDGYINKKGETVIPFKDNYLEPKEFNEGLAPVIKGEDKSCSYINKKGKIVIDKDKISPVTSYCGNFYEGLRVFYIDSNPKKITTGYIDRKGRIKYSRKFDVPEIYSDGEFSVFEDFSSNMAQFTIDYKTGYIDKKFKTVIPPIYEFARDFDGDLAYVKYENKEGYINKKGQWMWSKEREGM